MIYADIAYIIDCLCIQTYSLLFLGQQLSQILFKGILVYFLFPNIYGIYFTVKTMLFDAIVSMSLYALRLSREIHILSMLREYLYVPNIPINVYYFIYNVVFTCIHICNYLARFQYRQESRRIYASLVVYLKETDILLYIASICLINGIVLFVFILNSSTNTDDIDGKNDSVKTLDTNTYSHIINRNSPKKPKNEYNTPVGSESTSTIQGSTGLLKDFVAAKVRLSFILFSRRK